MPADTLTFTGSVPAPLEKVFSLLTDPTRLTGWLPGCVAAQAHGPMKVGTRLEVRFQRGNTVFEIIDWHPPTAFGWSETGGRRGTKTLFKLDFAGGSTVVTMRHVWTPQGLRAWFLGAILRRRNARIHFEWMLNNLRMLVTRS